MKPHTARLYLTCRWQTDGLLSVLARPVSAEDGGGPGVYAYPHRYFKECEEFGVLDYDLFERLDLAHADVRDRAAHKLAQLDRQKDRVRATLERYPPIAEAS